jgi:hypothetical protein
MAREYDHYLLEKADEGLSWRFRTKATNWTDLHLVAPIPCCDALGLRVSAPQGIVSFRVDLVDGRGIPWSSVPVTVEGAAWQTFSFPIADFRLADYAHQSAAAPEFPAQEAKLVADAQPGTEYTLNIGAVTMQWGDTCSERVCLMGDAGLTEGPLFFVTDPAATPLGRLTYGGQRYTALAERRFPEWTSVVVTIPFTSREFLAALLDRAGVHRYLGGTEDVLLANRSLLALHTRPGGPKRVRLTRETLVDLFTGQRLEAKDGAVLVEMAPASTRLFRRVPQYKEHEE